MTTHEEWVVKCPSCERAYDLFWISSGNNFGGKFWSDGCATSDCSYPLTGLYFCNVCRWVFTIGDCEKIAPDDPSVDDLFSSRRKWLRNVAPEQGERRKRYLNNVRMENCAALVSLRRWSPQNDVEPILRLGWWWNEESEARKHALSIDDALNAEKEVSFFLSERILENMMRLIEVLGNEARTSIIMGDIKRRLGNFDAAIAAYLRMPSYQTELSGKLVALSQKKYRSVVRIR